MLHFNCLRDVWTYTTTSVLIFLFDKKAAISVADPGGGLVGGLEAPSLSNLFCFCLIACIADKTKPQYSPIPILYYRLYGV